MGADELSMSLSIPELMGESCPVGGGSTDVRSFHANFVVEGDESIVPSQASSSGERALLLDQTTFLAIAIVNRVSIDH